MRFAFLLLLLAAVLVPTGCCPMQCCPRQSCPVHGQWSQQGQYGQYLRAYSYAEAKAPGSTDRNSSSPCKPVYETVWDERRGWITVVTMVPETSKKVSVSGPRMLGEAQGAVRFDDLREDVYTSIRSVDPDFLLSQIKAALPEGYSLDETEQRIVENRRVTLMVRKPEGQVVFKCRTVATINPVAKQIEFKITSGGDVDAAPRKFDQVAEDLKAGLLKALSRRP